MINDIFFSVMICCYNSEKYLRETIDSVIKQTYTNWEIVAINDGSTDNTEKIIMSYINKGIPITYHKQKNKGFAAARNKAMELAKSDWIAIIDHDDICMPNRLEVQRVHIKNNPNVQLVFGNALSMNRNGVSLKRLHFDRFNPCKLNLTKGKAMNSLLANGCFIPSQSIVFNKEAALSIGRFNTSYKFIVDYDFCLRMGSKFDLFGGEELVAKWRSHKDQVTEKMKTVNFKEGNQNIYNYFFFNGVTIKTKFRMILNLVKRNLKAHFN